MLSFKEHVRDIITAYRARKFSQSFLKRNKDLFSRFPVNLSKAEKEAVDSKWGGFPINREWNYMYHSIFKSIRGFSPDFVPAVCCYPYIIRTLNPTGAYEALQHKALTGLYLKDFTQPTTYIRIINGTAYDADFRVLKDNAFISDLAEISKTQEMIVKQAKDTACGRNITFIPMNSDTNTIMRIIKSYESDIVIQAVIRQSEITAKLNPTSVNSCRISTLNLNGVITPVNVVIKAGGIGKRVDNAGGGNGGAFMGVSDDGKISTTGYKTSGDEVKIPDLPKINISEIKDFAVQAHSHLPHIGLAGWDIALDENEKPIMIEVNLRYPGITIEQIASGPFFADRTDEVLEYIRSQGKFNR